jgi:Short-chain dehydrogenases of various substrate specificities
MKIFFISFRCNQREKSKDVLSKLKQIKSIDIVFFLLEPGIQKKEKEIDIDQMKKVMNVNFFGTLNCIKAVEKYFREKNSGHISIVSSIAGYRGLPNSTGYGASKAALNNLAESLYFDFGRNNVRVSLVSPGFIKTQMTDKNQFKMPFLKTAEYAADKIYKGLINGSSFEIDFPKELTLILKFLKILPDSLYFKIIKKLTKYQKR